MTKRIERLNSLLKQVIAEVVARDVSNPKVNSLITITRVDTSKDLHNAKVYISVIGTEAERKQTLEALKSAAGFISVHAAKKVVLRYFPHLTFHLDASIDNLIRIDELIREIHDHEGN